MKNRITNLSFLLAIALMLGYVESLVPLYIGVPGAKLGLPNLAIILTLYLYGTKEALTINILRIILSGLLFGSLYSIIYSLAGGLLSLFSMIIFKKTKMFSLSGISIIGGVSHNIGQIIIAMLVVRTFGIIYYLPFLLILGCVTGLIIGVLANTLMPYLKKVKETYL